MAKKKRKAKRGKKRAKRAKSYRVSGVITRIRKKTKKARAYGPVFDPKRAGKSKAAKAVKKVVKEVEKGLKYPFKGSGKHVFGMKMRLRPKRKRTHHLPDFTD